MASPTIAAGAYAATQRLANPTAGRAMPGVGGAGGGGPSFAEALGNVLQTVADAGKQADQQASKAAMGKADMVDVVTAVAETETALETLVAVRDRVIAAYEEIMRMQI
ncbi:flagellar hook-basal body complex protein FliE 1 [Alsobacter metallidurans]|uniref:Flagellar hook-basal body complex protein FliE n=1 Tax=Alsobacter metallidurans TaxID=340221 RepID=A0A917I9L4_9HYPH|nr:flagellar hook-basal body complex protein FliE [Alsobacter metallidurans]GGH26407.1 flagellar hook-basal body complex protein FliE 1 [Alsobacter metallidurans]